MQPAANLHDVAGFGTRPHALPREDLLRACAWDDTPKSPVSSTRTYPLLFAAIYWLGYRHNADIRKCLGEDGAREETCCKRYCAREDM